MSNPSNISVGGTGPTGPTGPFPPYPMPGMTGLTGVAPSPFLLTLEQLMNTQTAAQQRETTHRTELQMIVTPNMGQLNPLFIQWATAGFPENYTLMTLDVDHPSPCSDGVTRTTYEYISFLLGKDLGETITKFDGFFDGMTIAYNITGSVFKFVVSKTVP